MVLVMLEGKNVNLRVVETEDIPLLTEWYNSMEFQGEYFTNPQKSRTDWQKELENPVALDNHEFLIEKRDGTKIGHIGYGTCPLHGWVEIGFALIPKERSKGYGTEAIQLMVDYLFLSKDTPRITINTDARNVASVRAAEKAGFKKEGIIRKGGFTWGQYADACILGILREDWKEPKILTKT
jgi:RimJ/RimL family protein N-acetyltransferase